MEQIPSRRRANHRDVVRKRNQASVNVEQISKWLWSGQSYYVTWKKKKKVSDVSAGLDSHQRLSGTCPLPEMLGWSTSLEEMRTSGRRPDFELEDEEHTWTARLRIRNAQNLIFNVALGKTHWLTQGASHLVKSAGSSGEGRRRRAIGEAQGSKSREWPMLTQQLHPGFVGTTGQNKKRIFLISKSKTFVLWTCSESSNLLQLQFLFVWSLYLNEIHKNPGHFRIQLANVLWKPV